MVRHVCRRAPSGKTRTCRTSFCPNGIWLSPDGAVTCCSTVPSGTTQAPAGESGACAGMAKAAARFGDEAGGMGRRGGRHAESLH